MDNYGPRLAKSKYRTGDKDMSQETGKYEQVVIDAIMVTATSLKSHKRQ